MILLQTRTIPHEPAVHVGRAAPYRLRHAKDEPFIICLFTNDEVLGVDQDSLGRQGWRAKRDGDREVLEKPFFDGVSVAFFNRDGAAADVSINWKDLGLSGPETVRDLWRQRNIGVQDSGYRTMVAAHGAELFKLKPATRLR